MALVNELMQNEINNSHSMRLPSPMDEGTFDHLSPTNGGANSNKRLGSRFDKYDPIVLPKINVINENHQKYNSQ